MNNHYSDMISFFFFYMSGCLLAIFSKMDDINKMNERLTFAKAVGQFIKYEYKSYVSSIMIGILYAAGHDQIIEFFKNNKLAPDAILSVAGASPLIASFAFGFMFHALGYKFIFGRLQKIYGKQIQDEVATLRQENEQLKELVAKKK